MKDLWLNWTRYNIIKTFCTIFPFISVLDALLNHLPIIINYKIVLLHTHCCSRDREGKPKPNLHDICLLWMTWTILYFLCFVVCWHQTQILQLFLATYLNTLLSNSSFACPRKLSPLDGKLQLLFLAYGSTTQGDVTKLEVQRAGLWIISSKA